MSDSESLSPYTDYQQLDGHDLLVSVTSSVLHVLGDTKASITYFLTWFYLYVDHHLNFLCKQGKITIETIYDSFFLKVGKI